MAKAAASDGTKTNDGTKTKKTRVMKPKKVFMLYKGTFEGTPSFTRDPLEVLERVQAEGLSYKEVVLPAPTPRKKADA